MTDRKCNCKSNADSFHVSHELSCTMFTPGEVMDGFRRAGIAVPPEAPTAHESHNYHADANGISLMYRNGVTILLRTFQGTWFAVTVTVKLKTEEFRRTARASDDDSWLRKEIGS